MRNIALLVILSSLVGYVYFFEEKKSIEAYRDREKAESLLDLRSAGDMLSLKTAKFHLEKRGDNFFVDSDFEVAQKQLDTFFSQLENIRVQRILTQDELNEVNPSTLESLLKLDVSVSFKNSILTFSLGKKIEFNQNFYLKITNSQAKSEKWVIAKYQNTYSGKSSEKNQYRSDIAYKQIISLFSLGSDFFKNKFPFNISKNFKVIKVESFRNRPYEIKGPSLTLDPTQPNGIEESKDRINFYLKGLKELQAKSVSKVLDRNKLKDSLGKITIDDKAYEMFRNFKGKRGYFLNLDKYIYEFDGAAFRHIFSPQQDFWIKKFRLDKSSDLTIKDMKDNVVLVSKLTDKNIWTQVMLGEAHSVRDNNKQQFKAYYKVINGKKTFLVRQSDGGLELLDVDLDVIFHFLEKIK